MRTYSYNHIFANRIIMILVCALEVIIEMCLQQYRSGGCVQITS